MKYIKLYETFLNEKKVQVKRKWGSYPAKRTSTSARVRNAIFDAMTDGIITEDELKRILFEIGANSKWLSKNKNLFIISEVDGIASYGLSKFGKRIFNAISLSENVHGNPNMNTQGMNDVKFPHNPGDANSFSTQETGSGDIPFDLNNEENDEESEYDDEQLKLGISVEMEHTDDPKEAKKIAQDHLKEDPKYYSKLYKAGLIDEPDAIKIAKKINKNNK